MQSNADWDSVTVIRKSKPAAKDLKSSSAINKALASGTAEITRKSIYIDFLNLYINFMVLATGGSNKHGSDTNLVKIETSDELKGILYFLKVYPLIFN